jgi:hypothetical protein
LNETLAMIGMTKPNDEQVQLLINGTEILVGGLGQCCFGDWAREALKIAMDVW